MKALDELRLFDHLSRTRHFGRTSAECHVSQPTLSRTISRLEAELGVRLFDRDRRSVVLTADGLAFGEFVQQVLAAWSAYAERRADHGDDQVTGSLSLFCTVTAAQTILPEVLARFRDRHPGVTLRLETGYAAEALDMLESGAVDVSVAMLPPRPPKRFVTTRIATTPLVLVAQADGPHRLSPSPTEEWSRVPFVLPATGLVRSLADRWFRRLRVKPVVAAEEPGHEALLALVALGCGIGIVPELVLTGTQFAPALVRVPVSTPLPPLDIAACTTPERLGTPAVAAFWATLAEGESGVSVTPPA